MLNIRQLSKLLGISPQTIRMYEQQGVFRAERSESNYRKFGRDAITTLMKCRKLMGMGFSIRQIVELARGVSYRDGQRMLRQQADELEREIRLLMEKRRGIAHMYTFMRDIQKKQGTCEMGTTPAVYLCPVMRSGKLLFGKDAAFLDKWNEYAFLRHDVKRIPTGDLMGEAPEGDYVVEYGVRVEVAERLGFDLSHAYRMEEQQTVIAYAVIPENCMKPVGELFGFAADYIRENRLTIRMDPFIFLPFWPHHGEHENHLVMMIPVTLPGEGETLDSL